jgi:hypothetical protein
MLSVRHNAGRQPLHTCGFSSTSGNPKAKDAATYVKDIDAVSGGWAQEILRTARGCSRNCNAGQTIGDRARLCDASAEAAARLCDTRRIAGQARLNCSHELKIQAVMIGGEGEIRTHVPELPDHPISSRRRYDHFGTSPAEQFRADVCHRRVRPPRFAGVVF